MNWKHILYSYVDAANRRETDYATVQHAEFVVDERFRQMERFRGRRIKYWHDERGAKPLGCDTVLTVTPIREGERAVTVEIQMRKKIHIRTLSKEHVEEKVEQERIVLERSSDAANWVITKIEPIAIEGYPSSGHADAKVEGWVGKGRGVGNNGGSGGMMQSVPFINETIVSSTVHERSAAIYDREAAKRYADAHWNDPNPEFIHFDVDCTNYVSQCLYAGGAPMNYTEKRETGWWYRGKSGQKELWSYSWSVAHALYWLLKNNRSSGLSADLVNSPGELTIGDVICYDFGGNGRFQHSAIVTGVDGKGMPLVNAHTTNSKSRYWDYHDSYAWTEQTQYRFFHIRDQF